MKQKFTMPDGELIEKEMPMWKTPYNHDRDFESDRTGTYCADPSLTKQEFKDETDINVILERFMKTGEPPPVTLPEHFIDATEKKTWREMAEIQAEMSAKFYTLPPALRFEFLNDPNQWADAVVTALDNNDKQRLEAFGIELAKPEEAKPDVAATGVAPAPSAAPAPSPAPKTGDPNPPKGG